MAKNDSNLMECKRNTRHKQYFRERNVSTLLVAKRTHNRIPINHSITRQLSSERDFRLVIELYFY